MLWMDYTIESFPDGSFTIRGDWPGEVMGMAKNGNKNLKKSHSLYEVGDVFIVNEHGILRKVTDTEAFSVYKQAVNRNKKTG